MRIAADAIPGSLIPMWFKPIKAGNYEVVCGQLCGLGHYGMKGMVVVDEPADYQTWLKERAELAGTQNAPPPTQQPPGAPPVGPTPGTVPPPGAPKNENPAAKPEQKPAQPAPTPSGEWSKRANVAQRSRSLARWLNRFVWFTAFATLLLICSGGMVT